MAVVSLRVDGVHELSGGSFEVEFTVMVGTTAWQPHQIARGTTAVAVRDDAIAIATRLVAVEKERQKMHVGDIVPTGLTLDLP